ncbi:MAG: glycoside hydrolase family 70 protein, partial [Liquorilactobacillus satsumensis]
QTTATQNTTGQTQDTTKQNTNDQAQTTATQNTTGQTQDTTKQNTNDQAQTTATQNTTGQTQDTTKQTTNDQAQAAATQNTTGQTQDTTKQTTNDQTQATTKQTTNDQAQAAAAQNTTGQTQATTKQTTNDQTQTAATQNTTGQTQDTTKQTTNDQTQTTATQNTTGQTQDTTKQNTNDQTKTAATQNTTGQTQDTTKQTTNDQTQTTATQTKSLSASDTHIKSIDGKTYFVGDDGQVKKNFTAVINGQVLYFDKDTGALASNDKQYTNGLVNIGNQHNAAYSTTTDSFTQVDGYLTAESWYRPKDILKNGTTWTASTTTDFRPLLMTWWPDKNTQLAYLEYMQKAGLLEDSVSLSNTSTQAFLTNEALSAQANIEKKISLAGNTDWLKTEITQFVDAQPNWNIKSESKGTDHLQGGALLYVNSSLTPAANSDSRLLNRTPKNQEGQIPSTENQGGYEMLLANDVDNSNPVVQAEQLNWLYYMMNIGTIAGNDSSANFDGYRVDAVDNVDADLLQIASDYFKDAYGTNQSDSNANNHLSILEDWESSDADYVKEHGNNQLTMDFHSHLAVKYSLNMPTNERSGLEPELTYSLVNRTGDNSTENVAQPNYSFIRAHDSEVQTVIAQIIKDKINPDSDGLTVTSAEIAQAFKIYNQDELQADKKYTAYNIPSSYALLLTNKDTVPRVYYGDLFTDDGQYMATHSPYYDALTALLKARVKYVSGGQNMGIQYVQGDNSMASSSYRGVLTSVRYGKDALSASSTGDANTRTQGMAVVLSNNPDLKLSQSDQVVVNMGAAHRNQAYRALLLTTKEGLKVYSADDGAPVVYTNDLGQLIFKRDSIFGVSDPQVSGYLAAWVPVGASSTQDARTASSTAVSTDGSTFHSNAALDSQVIFEGFSNFQAMPTQTAEYTNVKIAQNAQLFKDLGITSFELAPQYRSSTDASFLDSVVQNGYAFTDRYDVGYNTPTKYGTVAQLLSAIKALHAQGIQAINDWVPDQIYNLPGEEIVTAERTNSAGIYDQDSAINNTLYDSHTVGGGQYQAMYGGAFLDKIKQLYPDLFKTKQISTGQSMNPNEKITEWSAKYFNGSNIQGRGAWYVLKDWATNKYFSVSSNNSFLPKQLQGKKASTGFVVDSKNRTKFYSTSGYQAKNTFIQDGDNWYYFDNNGYMVTGADKINGYNYYFLPNGIELQDAYFADGTKEYYYSKSGKQILDQYYQDSNGNWRYFFKDGTMAKGLTQITAVNGQTVTQYFDTDGIQVKGNAAKDSDGKLRYFDGITGNMVVNSFGELPDGSWLYLDENGVAVTGKQNINGQTMYFNADGRQVKNDFGELADGSWLYLNSDGVAVIGEQVINGKTLYFNADGKQVKNDFKQLADGSWLYLNSDGVAVTGKQVINGKTLYFNADGKQVKNDFKQLADGSWLYLNGDGVAVTGEQVINGKTLYFNADGKQVKNDFKQLADGSWLYLNGDGVAVTGKQVINGKTLYFNADGKQVKNDFKQLADGSWLYLNSDGVAVTGEQVINGKTLYFNADGKQVKNDFKQLADGSWVYLNGDGVAVTGEQVINGKTLYFNADGRQVKNDFKQLADGSWVYLNGDGVAVTGKQVINGKTLYFNADGRQVKNDFKQLADGSWLYLNSDGVAVTGEQVINGKTLYFNADGKQVKNDFKELANGSWLYLDGNGVAVTGKQVINGQTMYFNADGTQVKNDFGELADGSWLYLGADGVAVTGKQTIRGQKLYFRSNGIQVKGGSVLEEDGQWHTYDLNSGEELR